MLDKYQCFYKLSKISQCSIYTAFNRQAATGVLIKRIRTPLAWNEILCHKHVQLISRVKVFPKMNEIFRHKGYFYFVFQKPYGNSLSIVNPIQKTPLSSFIQLMADLLQSVFEISQKVPNLVILPQWIYFHRNNLKLLHFQPFLNRQPGEQEHIATHLKQSPDQNPQLPQQKDQSDYVPDQYRKCLVFHLGLIAYRFATGKKEENIRTTEEYLIYVNKIRQLCQRQVSRATEDPRIANFVNKMISDNKFQVPTLEQVTNFFQARNKEQKNRPTNKQLTVQIQLQKINLTAMKGSIEPKRKLKNCCLREIKPKTLIIQEQIKKIGLKSLRQIKAVQKSTLLLPYLSLNSQPSMPRQRNMSCINRHKPLLTNRYRSMTYKQHIKSHDAFKNDDQN